MDWVKSMNNAVDYIEANLADEINFDKVAQTACCSTYHFQRMFSYITGVSLSEYIRRRRLTLAAFELRSSDCKIIDIALKYGYDSPDAFGRAFKNMHGMTPTSVRGTNAPLKAYPKMNFSISIKGDREMHYRIEKRDVFEVFGIYTDLSYDMQQAFIQAPAFVKEKIKDGKWKEFNDLLGRPFDTWFHAAIFDQSESGQKFMLCCHTPPGLEILEQYTRLKVDEKTWAIFPATPLEMQSLWLRIYSEWFPTTDYEQVPGIAFEMWYGYGIGDFGYGVSEIWIPVKKKQ